MTERPRSLRVELNDEEYEQLRKLSEAEKLSVSALIRRYIAKAYARRFATKQREEEKSQS